MLILALRNNMNISTLTNSNTHSNVKTNINTSTSINISSNTDTNVNTIVPTNTSHHIHRILMFLRILETYSY